MPIIRAILVSVVGLGLAIAGLFVAAIVALAAFGFSLAAGLAIAIASRLSAGGRKERPREPRVWNDGHGTVIDM